MKSAGEWLLAQNSFTEEESFEAKKQAKTISITSGKGGVGKTSISLKLGQMLADEGSKVLLIDCDYNLSNTAVKLGLPITDNFLSLISAKKEFDDCIQKMGNFHLLSGCNGNVELFDNGSKIDSFIIDIISAHERDYDYILLDCAAGIGREILNLNAYCDYRFVVVTPDKSSITDSYSLIKMLNTKYGVTENHLLINKVSNQGQYRRIVKSLSETVENFLSSRLNVLGGIKQLETQMDKFDEQFFGGAKSAIHKNFVKVLSRFADERVDVTTSFEMNVAHCRNDKHGHDVQPTV